jgi:galactofuranosylgalactofuranosylrhamnosyl-N-acetylglucosaminyl-diphospho-decaprenol beta-1,5/1,6-galactofuranosyltransferase
MAVWHVPWTDKDDTTDWQAYYHARNRILMALGPLAVRPRR